MYTLIIEDRTGNIAKEFSFEEGSYTLGRVEGNDLVLASNSVSRTHARIYVNQGRCFIEDLGSSNGVIVDGQRVPSSELRNASQIRIGDFTLYLEFNERAGDPGQDVLRTHIVANNSDTYKLVRVGDVFAGEEFNLTEENNSVGRTDDNFILLSDPSISRNHARIVNQGLLYVCEDLGSSNGTRVNGKSCKKPIQLKAGDEVQFGNVRFIFVPSHQQIDPTAYAAPPTSSGSGAIIALVLLLFFLILGGGFAFYWFAIRDSDDGSSTTPEETGPSEEELRAQEIDAKFQAGLTAFQKQDWPNALRLFNGVLALDPAHQAAVGLKEQVEKELVARNLYEEGIALKSSDLKGARSKLEQVDPASAYGSQAQQEIESINSSLAVRAFAEVNKSCEDKPDEACITQICESLELNPEFEQARTFLRELATSRKLRKKKDLKKQISACLSR